MRGFYSILQNLFWKIVDWKSFWFFLVLTILTTCIPLLFSFKEYEDESKKKQVARNVLSRTLIEFPFATAGENLKLSDYQEKENGKEDPAFSVNVLYKIERRNGLIVTLHRFRRERMVRIGKDYGVRNLSFPGLDYTVKLGDASETVSLSPSETDKLKRLREVRDGDPIPEFFLAKFKSKEIRDLLQKKDWDSVKKKTSVELSFPMEYSMDPDKFVGTRVAFLGSSESKKYNISKTDFVYTAQKIMIDYLAGFGGVFFAVILTAGIVPGMFDQGKADLLFSKGTPRWVVFLGHFSGAAIFYGLLSFVFLFFTGLFFTLQTGVQSFYLVLFVVPMLLLFFVVYSITALIGVVLEDGLVSIIGSIIGSMIVWFLLFGIRILAQPVMKQFFPDHWSSLFETLSAILPSTGEVKALIWRMMPYFVDLSPVLKNSLGESSESTTAILCSSFGFLVVLAGASILLLNRKEL